MGRGLQYLAILLCLAMPAIGQADPDVLAKMRTEAMDRSQVAPVFDTFTVAIGPRLTGSPAHKRAAEFTRNWLDSQGLSNARLEPFQFGRGWELEKLTLEITEPRYAPLIGYADAWSSSTHGEIVGTPVFIGGKTVEELDGMRARLKGAIVLSQPPMTNFVRTNRPGNSSGFPLNLAGQTERNRLMYGA
jgi:carboxypeptidase Q